MVKASPFQDAFNSGEFSQRMDARVSFDKYTLAVSRALNMVPLPQGGLTFRPGTRFVIETKTSSAKSALYDLTPSSADAYVGEFGANYLRFCQNQGQLSAPTVATVVTNGTFNANITNWSDRSTGTASIAWDATAKLKLVGSGDGYAWAEQSITVAGGDQSKLHVFRFTLSGNPGGKASVQVGTTSTGYDLWNKSGYGIGQHTVEITPGASPIYFQIINKQNENLYLDDVSILTNTPLELTNTPYSAAQVANLRFSHSNDVFYVFHPSYAPRKIERRGDYSWSFTTPFFEDGPWGEINPDVDLSAANLVKNPSFDSGLGQYWRTDYSAGSVEFDGSQGVVFFHLHPHNNNQHAYVKQTITTPAANSLHVMHFQAVGRGQLVVKVGSSDGGAEIVAEVDYDPGWYSISFTPGVGTFYILFGAVTGVDSADDDIPGVGGVFIYNVRNNLLTASATNTSATVTAAGDFRPFAATDVGRSLRLEHAGREAGWGVITAYTNNQTVTVRIYRVFASTVGTETWRFGAWSDTTGWPTVGTLFQQRFLAANTSTQPQSFWGSQSGDFQNMRPDSWVEGASTVEDDDAFAYTIAAKKVSPIRWFVAARRLLVGTATGQWVLSSKGIALTPSDLQAEQQTTVRTAFIEPVAVNTTALFVELDQRSIDDIGYNFQIDGFQAADLNILADHIGYSGNFVQMVIQTKPYGTIWVRKNDGQLGVLAYKREQNVVGWGQAQIAGSAVTNPGVVESIASVPGDIPSGSQVYTSKERDELWVIVKRTINGSVKRYIEVMEGYFRGPNRAEYDARATWLSDLLSAQADAVYVDSAVTYSGASATVLTNIAPHLIGESVMVNGNGLSQGPFTVAAGGTVTVTNAVTKAHIGLSASWKVRGLKMNYGAQSGSSVGQKKQIGTSAFVVLDGWSFQYGVEESGEKGRDPVFFTASAHLASDGTLYTGEVVYDKADADVGTDPRFIIKGASPLPFTILGLAPKTITNER